jgi:hypothetical protein
MEEPWQKVVFPFVVMEAKGAEVIATCVAEDVKEQPNPFVVVTEYDPGVLVITRLFVVAPAIATPFRFHW